MTVAEWLSKARTKLTAIGVESSKLEAEVIAAKSLGKSRSWVLAHGPDPFPHEQADILLARRLSNEPLAYILGEREFYKRTFRVGPEVLIPRHDTETLIEAFGDLELGQPGSKVLDVGTGSGCIAVTIALEWPEIEVCAIDISAGALNTATENATRLGAKVEFILSDGYQNLQARRFDVIVSNPPYVAQTDPLPADVHRFEPHVALYAGENGLDVYHWLASESPRYLNPGGTLLTEIGMDMGPNVVPLFLAQGWELKRAWKDLAGIERVLAFRMS